MKPTRTLLSLALCAAALLAHGARAEDIQADSDLQAQAKKDADAREAKAKEEA